jgi:hypothetical protein
VSRGPRPRLLTEVSSGAVTCPSAPDLTSLQRWAPALSCVPRPRTAPPCRGELRRCHVSHGLGSRLLAEVSSDVATCPTAQCSAFLRGELRCGAATCPTSPGGLWTPEIKKGLAALGTQLGSRVFKAHSCVTEAPADVHAATMRLYNAASAALGT